MAEVSVGTYIGRRDLSQYHVVRQEGVQVLVSRDLAQSLSRLHIDLKKFLFLRHLKALVELADVPSVASRKTVRG